MFKREIKYFSYSAIVMSDILNVSKNGTIKIIFKYYYVNVYINGDAKIGEL